MRSRTAFVTCLWAASACALADGARTVEDVAEELANPLAPVTTLSGNVRAEMGNGPDDDTNYQLRLQPSFFRPLADESALLVRTVRPLRSTRWPTNADGVGDISIVPQHIPDATASTFDGFGGALIAPRASRDELGSGKWAAGPAVIVPGGRAANLTSEATFKWNIGSRNEWTIPLTMGVSRVVPFESEFVNFGLACVNYLDHPAGTASSETRLSATYVLR